jgi:hypothetical protein
MKTFLELREINVSKFIEKKGNLSYLSWTHAVDVLLQNDPDAIWDFPEPTFYKGGSVMVHCIVYAFGKTVRMHLPVMDYKNNSVIDPSSRQISDAMMRCLAKCIACFGIGLYIYAGEDLPDVSKDDDNKAKVVPIKSVAVIKESVAVIKESVAEIKPMPMKGEGKMAMTITPLPNGTLADWISLAYETSLVSLEMAQTQSDCKTLYRSNKNIYEYIQLHDKECYDKLIAAMTETKEKLPNE